MSPVSEDVRVTITRGEMVAGSYLASHVMASVT